MSLAAASRKTWLGDSGSSAISSEKSRSAEPGAAGGDSPSNSNSADEQRKISTNLLRKASAKGVPSGLLPEPRRAARSARQPPSAPRTAPTRLEPTPLRFTFDVRYVNSESPYIANLSKKFALPAWFENLPWNSRSDFATAALLAEYGGVVLDTDVILVNSLEPYVALLRHYQTVAFGRHPFPDQRWSVHHGVLITRPQAELFVWHFQGFSEWAEERM